jgi:hypothetical protein
MPKAYNFINIVSFHISSIFGRLSEFLKHSAPAEEVTNSLDSTSEKKDEVKPDDKEQYHNLIDQLSAVRTSKKTAEYKALADQFLLNRKGLLSPYWSEDYKILTGGASNLLTAEIHKDDSQFFVKVTKNRKDSEFRFYIALLDGLVIESGDHYTFIKPIRILSDGYVQVYVFPFLKINIIKYNEETISLVIKALAEVTALHRSQSALRKIRLHPHSFELSESALKMVEGGIVFEDKDQERAALKRHEAILADWESVTSRLKKLRFSLCSRDIRQENLAIVDGKLTLFDMGAVALAPPGVDLYQLIHETRDIFSRRQICQDYAAALKELGMKKSAKDIEMAACAASAYKWLNVSERDASTLKAKNYLYALDCAEFARALASRDS